MANEQSGVKFFVIYTIIAGLLACPSYVHAAAEDEGESPLWEVAQALLRESTRNSKGGSGLSLIGGLVQGFVQSEGGKQLGDILAGNQKGGGGGAELLSSLGALWQAARSQDAGAEDRKEESGLGFDPAVLGTIIDLFSTLGKSATNDVRGRDVEQKRGNNEKKEEWNVDWEGVINMAGNAITSMSGNKDKGRSSGGSGGFESLLSLLPVLLNSMSGRHNIHASKSIPHHSHEQFLPPILENLHEYWDHFSNSEFGKTLWENSGLAELAKLFTDGRGQVEIDRVFGSLENNALRRMWVKGISSFVAQWVKHFTDPQVQGRYMDTVRLVCNSFLQAQGYPKETHIDLDRPAESLSALANAVFKKQFNLDVNSSVYVKPAVAYIQDIFGSARKKGFGMSDMSTEDIETRLSETLDAEIIEPVLRVNRAFRFGSNRRECARYVICAINRPQDASKSGLKPGVTKLASLGASWFLSSNQNIDFWQLYNAAVDEGSCKKYDKMCEDFDSEDMRATTEYFHNEL